MGQILHGSARTTEAVRRAIQNSQESIAKLAKRYNLPAAGRQTEPNFILHPGPASWIPTCLLAAGGNNSHYAGGSIGYGNISDDFIEGLEKTASRNNIKINVDDNDLGWKLFAGYNFNQYFGAEFAYVDLGKVEAGIDAAEARTNFVATGAVSVSGEIDGFTFAGVGRYPVTGQLDIFGKVGGFYWDAKVKSNRGFRDVKFIYLPGSESDSGISYVFGLGAEYKITENFSLRPE